MSTASIMPDSETVHFSESSPQPSTGPILVAADGGPDSDAAIVAGHRLAARFNTPLHIVAVVEPLITSTIDAGLVPAYVDSYGPHRATLQNAVEEQCRRLLPAGAAYTLSLIDGEAAPVLAHVARERGDAVLVMGRGRHALLGRLLLGETVLRVLQLADVPVLAVEPDSGPPRRVLIATDFSPYSVYAARVALSLVDRDAAIHLVHVVPELARLTPALERLATGGQMLRDEMARVRREIGGADRPVEMVTLSGKPGRVIAEYAESTGIDLVVTGTHGYGFFNRLLLGSVATQLVRNAPCSVLTVPGRAAERMATRAAVSRGQARVPQAAEWSIALAEFSKRNVGRPCTIEIDDRDLGAQIQGQAIPLMGAAFDHHGNEVQIMLGAPGLRGRYLSHVVPDVQALEFVTDPAGRDQAVRIGSARGQTLLLFGD